MAQFENLPAELKVFIFEDLGQLSTVEEFDDILLVCKEWNSLANPLRWKHIAVSNDSLIPFLKSVHSARQSTCNLIKSLSVKIWPIPMRKLPFRDMNPSAKVLGVPVSELITSVAFKDCTIRYIRTPPFFTTKVVARITIQERACYNDISEWSLVQSALWELWAIIGSNLRTLTAFSFRVAARSDPEIPVYDPWQSLRLDQRLLGHIFRVLPPSCTSIEIDDAGMTSGDPSHRLCDSLRSVLPRLHHLQLKCGMLCSAFISDDFMNTMTQQEMSFSELRTMHINLRPSYDWSAKRSLTPCKCTLSRDEPGEYMVDNPEYPEGMRRQNLICASLRKGVDTGLFPKIESLRVNNGHGGCIRHNHHGYAHYSRTNILAKTIDTIPMLPIRFQHLKCYGLDCELAAVLPDGQEIFSMDVDKANVIEAVIDDAWLTTESGTRLPLTIQSTRECRRRGYVIADPRDRLSYTSSLFELVSKFQVPSQHGLRARFEVDWCLERLRRIPPRTIPGCEEPLELGRP